MSDDEGKPEAGIEARRLIRSRQQGALGTLMDGRPYVSLVAIACDTDGAPLLLLSDLARHTQNLLADPRGSLLFEATEGHADPLAGPRLTVIGRAERFDDPRALARFTARHPASAQYAGSAISTCTASSSNAAIWSPGLAAFRGLTARHCALARMPPRWRRRKPISWPT